MEQTEVKPVETNELFQEKHDEPQESKNNARADKEGIQEEPAHVVRTYILVGRLAYLWLIIYPKISQLHPMDQQHAYQAYDMMFAIIQKIFQEMDDMDNSDDDKHMGGGWKDDRRQLRIPQYQPR